MGFARHKGVNLSVLGIGVDFLQVCLTSQGGPSPNAVFSPSRCYRRLDSHVSAPPQVVSVFSSFGFKWPVQLSKLFAAASMSSFNDQLMAPECSIGTWSFEMK
jgi:hypothetical protein